MMTFYVCYQLQQQLFPEETSPVKIPVSSFATKVIGTRAKLKANDVLSLD